MTDQMNLYCFASDTLTNVWAGIGAELWAVSEASPAAMKGRATKAAKMTVGSAGLLYCNETHSFTTPFLVFSAPNPEEVIERVWKGAWRMPFRIHSLGTPRRQVHKDEAMKRWPVLVQRNATNVSAAMNLTGATVFSPVQISAEDWAIILNDLASARSNEEL